MIVQQPEQAMKSIIDGVSISTVVISWMGVLSTGLTIVSTSLVIAWTIMRIIEDWPKFKNKFIKK